ncbi:MAG: TylF/MycF/NovP-related O-methyltransferase [Chloroflexota bacterium]
MLKKIVPDYNIVKLLAYVKAMLQLAGYVLQEPSAKRRRVAAIILTVKPWYTMVNARRLINLYDRVQDASANNIPGAIVECGSWNGGASALMATAARDSGDVRQSWVFDSFEGVPPPTEDDGNAEHDIYFDGLNKGTPENVRAIYTKLGGDVNNLHIVKGWFADTLVDSDVEQIAVLHIDADWYEPVCYVLETFYERIVPGGYIIVDDYGYWDGATKALDDFAVKTFPEATIEPIGSVAAVVRKPLMQPTPEN